MIDIKLGELTWDIEILDGDLVLIRDTEEVVQHIRQRILTFLGEWFLDLSVGVPWIQEILGKPRDMSTVESILKEVIIGSPGVASLQSFEFSAGEEERVARLDFSVLLGDSVISSTVRIEL